LPRRCAPWGLLAILACGCGGGNPSADAGPPPAFPASYRSTYTMERPCRSSTDHDLNNVIVYADPTSVSTYTMRDAPFPTGSTLLKEEYDISDTSCTGPIVQWTVMVKLPDGTSAATLDWHWQKVDAHRNTLTDDDPRCYSCHKTCGVPPDGYLDTCSPPT
jgi:hypothetical protein